MPTRDALCFRMPMVLTFELFVMSFATPISIRGKDRDVSSSSKRKGKSGNLQRTSDHWILFHAKRGISAHLSLSFSLSFSLEILISSVNAKLCALATPELFRPPLFFSSTTTPASWLSFACKFAESPAPCRRYSREGADFIEG